MLVITTRILKYGKYRVEEDDSYRSKHSSNSNGYQALNFVLGKSNNYLDLIYSLLTDVIQARSIVAPSKNRDLDGWLALCEVKSDGLPSLD